MIEQFPEKKSIEPNYDNNNKKNRFSISQVVSDFKKQLEEK